MASLKVYLDTLKKRSGIPALKALGNLAVLIT
jgi:hypothetical protein